MFAKFVDHEWDEDPDSLMFRVRWFGYRAKDHQCEYVEDLTTKKFRAYCAGNDIDPDCPAST